MTLEDLYRLLRSGHVQAQGVVDTLEEPLLVLDGGLCSGEGATTVDVTEPYWKVIKEGTITEKELQRTLRGT